MVWSIEAAGAVEALASSGVPGTLQPESGTTGFAGLFERQLQQMNTDLRVAESALGDLAAGRPVELHEVMINLEKARISVQTFIQVRNKVVESYQDLMRMQM